MVGGVCQAFPFSVTPSRFKELSVGDRCFRRNALVMAAVKSTRGSSDTGYSAIPSMRRGLGVAGLGIDADRLVNPRADLVSAQDGLVSTCTRIGQRPCRFGQHHPSCPWVAVAVLLVQIVSLSSDGTFRSASAVASSMHIVTPASACGDFVGGRSDLVGARNTFVSARSYTVSARRCLVNARICSVTARNRACAASATLTT